MKHLNPRQGITTLNDQLGSASHAPHRRVKHLNPRQGITTRNDAHMFFDAARVDECETPKSPPGDYNSRSRRRTGMSPLLCETPKSPPGDYNNKDIIRPLNYELLGVKHLNPRQGITTGQYDADRVRVSLECVKHLNPRQGITTNVHVDLAFERVADACETPKSPPGDYNE